MSPQKALFLTEKYGSFEIGITELYKPGKGEVLVKASSCSMFSEGVDAMPRPEMPTDRGDRTQPCRLEDTKIRYLHREIPNNFGTRFGGYC